jgi:hypothetical protein
MKRILLILALLLVAVVAWGAWIFVCTPNRVRDIASRLPSEQSLDAMSHEQMGEQLKLATVECDRIWSLSANPFARLSRGDEIKELSGHCDMLKARQDALEGP